MDNWKAPPPALSTWFMNDSLLRSLGSLWFSFNDNIALSWLVKLTHDSIGGYWKREGSKLNQSLV